MSQHYFNSKMVAELMKWSLTTSKMTLSSEIEGTNEACEILPVPDLNLLQFASRLGQESANYSNLLLLLGAGGVLYLAKKSLDGTHAKEDELDPGRSHLTNECARAQVSPDNVQKSSSEEDLSLNSLSTLPTPKKFLKRPLYDYRQRGNTGRFKNIITRQGLDKQTTIANPCPRCVRGTCKLKKHQKNREIIHLEMSKRREGDGSEELERNYEEMLKVGSLGEENDHQYRPTSKLFARGVPDGRDILDLSPLVRSEASSRCTTPSGDLQDLHFPSMQNMVDNAREVRRLIRESSFDSLSSDYSLDFCPTASLNWSKEAGDEVPEEPLPSHMIPRNRSSSVLSDFSDQSSTDWESKLKSWQDIQPYKLALGLGASYAQSESGDEAWEWDNDGYYEDLGLERSEDLDILHKSLQQNLPWLPSDVSELDLETELLPEDFLTDKSSRSSSRSSSISQVTTKANEHYFRDSSRRYSQSQPQRPPPSGRSSVGPEIVSDEDIDDSVIQTSTV